MKPQILIIPGLGDQVGLVSWLTSAWKDFGVEVHVQKAGWYDGEEFQTKLKRMMKVVDKLKEGGPVFVIGMSAGGSFACNLFMERRNVIHKAVNLCGRLRTGHAHRIFRSLDNAARKSVAFKQSVLRFEEGEPQLSKKERSRLMTIRPAFGDEAVPSETVPIAGAYNVLVYSPEHILSMSVSLLFPRKILEFLEII